MALILTGSSGLTTLDSSAGLTFSDTSNQSAAASPYVLKNRIINGAMAIAQRGTSSTAGGYCCVDRWYFNNAGTSLTWSQTTATVNGVTANVAQIAGIAGNTGQNFNQKIEAANCYDLVGKNVTVSFWAYQTTGSAFSLQTNLSYATSLNNFASLTSISTNTTSIPNATWTYVTATFSSLPSGTANGLQLVFFANSPAITTGVFQFTFVQLEIGSSATPFEMRLYDKELISCQRYYETLTATKINGVTYTPNGDTRTTMPWVVTKRATPTVSSSGSLNVIAFGYAGDSINTSLGTIGVGAFGTTAVGVTNISNYAAFSGIGTVISWGDNSSGNFTYIGNAEL